jgi:hypothetical protein
MVELLVNDIFCFLLENRSPSSCKLKPLCMCCIVQNCPYFYAGEYKKTRQLLHLIHFALWLVN